MKILKEQVRDEKYIFDSPLDHEITTEEQAARGVRVFFCHRTDVAYSSHPSGYIRRHLRSGNSYPLNDKEAVYTQNESWFVNRGWPIWKVKHVYHMIHPEFRRLGEIRQKAERYKV